MKRKKRKSRAVSLLLSLCLLACMLPQSARAAGVFSDIPQGAWYAGAVQALVDKGVIQGTAPNKFSPGGRLTRAAFAAMLAKTALPPAEITQYKFKGPFTDVPPTHWANPYVNWANEAGIVNGVGKGLFKPDALLTRQDMAVMVTKFANATGRAMPAAQPAVSFRDKGSISAYAAASVTACQRAGVITGYGDGTFKPQQTASRAEAAGLYARFLEKCPFGRYEIRRTRVNGVPVSAVEFDPHDFQAQLVLAQGKVTGRESPSSIVSRSGAAIAVNAAFFFMDSYIPIGTMVSGGKVLEVDNLFAPAKSAFVMDSAGNCSIEGFSTQHTAVLYHKDGGMSVLDVCFNQKPMVADDPSRVVFTRDWGPYLTFAARDAIVVDQYNVVTQVVHGSDVEIPYHGYVIAQRAYRADVGDFFEKAQVGDVLDLKREFVGASTQDIQLSVGVGPCIVKNGQAYGNAQTYAAEGFKDPSITVYDARRSCIGIKADGRVVIATAYTNLSALSTIMLYLGCRDAVNCDGGGSSNLYVEGRWLYGPQSRPLNHMLVFK